MTLDSLRGTLAGAVLLPVAALSEPANDQFANATPILSTNVTVTGSIIAATKEMGEPNADWQPDGG